MTELQKLEKKIEARIIETQKAFDEVWEKYPEQQISLHGCLNRQKELLNEMLSEIRSAERSVATLRKIEDPKTYKTVSKCCNASMCIGGEGTTHYHVCDKCGKACDTKKIEKGAKEPFCEKGSRKNYDQLKMRHKEILEERGGLKKIRGDGEAMR